MAKSRKQPTSFLQNDTLNVSPRDAVTSATLVIAPERVSPYELLQPVEGEAAHPVAVVPFDAQKEGESREALGRVVMNQPETWVLDEPTSSAPPASTSLLDEGEKEEQGDDVWLEERVAELEVAARAVINQRETSELDKPTASTYQETTTLLEGQHLDLIDGRGGTTRVKSGDDVPATREVDLATVVDTDAYLQPATTQRLDVKTVLEPTVQLQPFRNGVQPLATEIETDTAGIKPFDPNGFIPTPKPTPPTKSIDDGNLHELVDQLSADTWTFADSEHNENGVYVIRVAFPQALTEIPEELQRMDALDTYTPENAWATGPQPDDPNLQFFDQTKQDNALQAMATWEDALNVRFEVVEPSDNVDLYFYGISLESGSAAMNRWKINGEWFQRIVLDTDGNFAAKDTSWGSSAFDTLIHEVGHALGLSHPGEYDATDASGPSYIDDAEYIQDTEQYSVMSYFDEKWTGGNYGSNSLLTPRTHDLYVTQGGDPSLYAPNWSTRSGNTTYGYNATPGIAEMFDFDNAKYASGLAPVMTIWDGGGYDTLDLSGSMWDVELNLNPGQFSSTHGLTNNISLAYVPGSAPDTSTGDIGSLGVAGGAPDATAGYIENAVGGDFDDTIIGNIRSNRLEGGDGNDTLEGGEGSDVLKGGAGDDTIYANTSDNITGSTDGDTILADLGEDTVYGSDGNDTIYGGSGDDVLMGAGGDDLIDGFDDDDDLKGGAGNDTLQGGSGDDTIYGNGDDDYISGGTGVDKMYGGSGNDTADFTGDDADWNISLTFETALRNGTDEEIVAGFENVLTGAGADTVHGTAGTNVIETGDGNDILAGVGGNDVLKGGAGNDTLDGGDDTDTLHGGAGRDTATYANQASSVHVDLSDSGQQHTGGGGRDTLIEIENLIGTAFDDELSGDAASNTLHGENGDDTLSGRAGNDGLKGGAGNDTLDGGDGNDLLVGGEGLDWASYRSAESGVEVSLSTEGAQDTKGAGMDTLIEVENIEGSNFGDWLSGDDAGNRINGNGGQDVITGGAGNDVINGGGGNDTLAGNAGNDVINGGGGFDWVLYTAGTDGGVTVDLGVETQNTGGGGVDTLIGIENASGSAYTDSLTGTDIANELRGNGGDDWIWGNGGADTVNGGAGSDAISGGSGADLIIGGTGNDHMWGGTGPDTFEIGDHSGSDWIWDFEVGSDVLDMTAVSGLNNMSQLDIANSDAGTEIGFGENSILLIGVDELSLSDQNFLI